MKLQNKIDEVNFLKEKFENSQIAFAVDFRGLTVKEMMKFRNSLKESGCYFKVIKNTLTIKAIQNTIYDPLKDFLTGPTAIIWNNKDPIKATKVLIENFKSNQKIVYKAGVFGGTLIKKEQLDALTKMPSKSEIFAQILYLIESPIQNILHLLTANASEVINIVAAYEDKLKNNNNPN
jgi:large subunit ribosomal protein L10